MIESFAKQVYGMISKTNLIKILAQTAIILPIFFFMASTIVFLFTGSPLMTWPVGSSGREFVLVIFHVVGTFLGFVFVMHTAGFM